MDVAGNTEAMESDTIKIDSTAPSTSASLQGMQGSGGWFTSSSVSVTLSATDAASGVAATYYSIDGAPRQEYAGSAFSVTGDGMHHISFFSVDMAGNTESVNNSTIKIDSVTPSTSIGLSGTEGTNGWYTGDVTVTLAATDATSGVGGIYYTLDGGARQLYTAPFPVSGDEIHLLQYGSVDIAGNQEALHTQDIKIDTTPPTLTVSGAQTYAATQHGGAVINFPSPIATDNLTTPTVVCSPPSGSFFPVGSTTVVVTATDDAGNQTQKSFQIIVNAVADRLVLSNPGQLDAGGLFSITVSAEDAFGNIDPTVQGAVALNPSSSLPGKLSGLPIGSLQNGVATFSNLSLATAGTYTLVAAGTGDLLAGTTVLSVVPAPQFKVTLAPATPGQTAAGQAFTVTIAALFARPSDHRLSRHRHALQQRSAGAAAHRHLPEHRQWHGDGDAHPQESRPADRVRE